MREILFRGKKYNGEWIEGNLINTVCKEDESFRDAVMILGLEYERVGEYSAIRKHEFVRPATVGQYTGLKDKNGKRIFEGDIVRTQSFSDRPYSKKAKFKQHIGVVRYDVRHYKSIHDEYEQDYKAAWDVDIKDYGGYSCCSWSAFYKCEVIGNIHDNPELLGGA